MQAVILAAGFGKRLQEYTAHNTKCMVEVNGVTLIERMLRQLDPYKLSKVIIVTGYEGDKLEKFVLSLGINTEIVFIRNERFEETNNLYSLFLASDEMLREDTLLLESDIIFEDRVIAEILEDPERDIALVDRYKNYMTGMSITLDDKKRIVSFMPEKNLDYNEIEKCYKPVSIYKFSREFSMRYYVPFLKAYVHALGKTGKYEQVLRGITLLDDSPLKAHVISDLHWYEINDIQDLDLASALFTEDEDEKTSLILGRFGGYWRYPEYLDYFYLVNPYFPPKKMVDELKTNFETLLRQYPSNMRVNSLLAAKEFSVNPDNIVIGNGAAEVIKSLMEKIEGRTGFVRPTFDEYPNRYNRLISVDYIVKGPDFRYTADELMTFFEDKEIKNLVIVNPDNPSGSFIPKYDMLKLLEWAKERKIKVIIDESFTDFSEEGSTLIDRMVLERYPNLYAIKSISKSYGVPGLRLGVLASGDTETIAFIKKDVSIWNINSFAEFYMQIAGKYHEEYIEALEKLKTERKRFFTKLSEIPGIRVIPSESNYFMAELTNGLTSKELKKRMLIKHRVFVKDITGKVKDGHEYLRIAIREKEDNDRFTEALKGELEL